MTRFKFYQDRQVVTVARDYYAIKADTLADAIQFITSHATDFEELERKYPDKVEFVERDEETMMECVDTERNEYEIFCAEHGDEMYDELVHSNLP